MFLTLSDLGHGGGGGGGGHGGGGHGGGRGWRGSGWGGGGWWGGGPWDYPDVYIIDQSDNDQDEDDDPGDMGDILTTPIVGDYLSPVVLISLAVGIGLGMLACRKRPSAA